MIISFLKAISLVNCLKILTASVIIFLAPVQSILISVGLLVIVDMILGILRSHVKKTRITSRKLAQTVIKMLIYQLAVITVYVLDMVMINDVMLNFLSIQLVATKIVALVIVIVEGKSIIENIDLILNINIIKTLTSFISGSRKLVDQIRGDDKNDEDGDGDNYIEPNINEEP